MKRIAFVIPAYNEEKTIATALKDIKSNFPSAKIFVVNDGSTDATKKIALKEGTTVLTHIINRGLGASLYTGIKAALKSNSKIIVTFDADLQHSAKDVKELIKLIKEKKADAVIGSRFLRKEDSATMPLTKIIGNKILTIITNFLTGAKITDSQSGLRVLSRKAAAKILIACDRYDVSSEIIHELVGHRFKIREVPIKAHYMEAKKGTNIISGISILFGMIEKKLGLRK